PRANQGLYQTAEPNAQVPLLAGRLRVTAGGSIAGPGHIELCWLPDPRLRFKLQGSPRGALATQGLVRLWGQRAKGRCLITDREPLSRPEPIDGLINGPFAIGGNPPVARLVVHLVNFPDFVGSPIELGVKSWMRGRALLSGSGWRFTIDGHANTRRLCDSLKSTGGYAITHIGVLEREDGTAFRPSKADDRLLCVGTFLSFAAGAWAMPQLDVGVAADGRALYREYGVKQVAPWGGRFRWFHEIDGASLEHAFTGFDKLWARSEWREPLRKLIYLYVEANDRPPDVGLVLAQAALEQMAWNLLVNDRQVLSRTGFDKLSAADQLRRLVATSGIPLDTPSTLRHLAGMNTPDADGPYWVTQLRNDFVHPPRGGQSARTSGRIVDAWLLGVWYLELALLRLMDYSGEYRSRLNSGEVSRVPWS
ncbi:MAG: hypothetical protein ACLQHS_12510, partial [Candidatus Limnocylindrales bacterium]